MNRVEYGKEEEANLQEKLGAFASCISWLSSTLRSWGYDAKVNKPKCWHQKGQHEKVGQRQKKSKPH